jgi:hypothetical protein
MNGRERGRRPGQNLFDGPIAGGRMKPCLTFARWHSRTMTSVTSVCYVLAIVIAGPSFAHTGCADQLLMWPAPPGRGTGHNRFSS